MRKKTVGRIAILTGILLLIMGIVVACTMNTIYAQQMILVSVLLNAAGITALRKERRE